MIKIRLINSVVFFYDFSKLLSKVAMYYVHKSLVNFENSILLGAYFDEAPCALAVISIDYHKRIFTVEHLEISNDFKIHPIKNKLMEKCMELAKNYEVDVIKFQDAILNSDSTKFKEYLISLGFKIIKTSHTIIWQNTDLSKLEWNKLLTDRGNSVLAILERKGFLTINFSDVNHEILVDLLNRMESEFPNDMNPFNIQEEVINEFSYATIFENHVVAFSIVSSLDFGKTTIFRYLAVSSAFIKKGVFFPCVVKTIDSFLFDSNCTKIAATIYSDNSNMLKLINNIFSFTHQESKLQNYFEYSL